MNIPRSTLSRNPFPGKPFGPEDQPWLHGRDRQLAELKARLSTHRFAFLSGAAGTGKSSLIQAGLIPSLLQQGHKALAGKSWAVTQAPAGADALASLTDALARRGVLHPDQKTAPQYREGILELLSKHPDGLTEACRNSEYVSQHNLLIVFDPAEAVLGKPFDPRVIRLLLQSLRHPDLAVYALFSFRPDQLSLFQRHEELSRLLPMSHVQLYPMSQAELAQAIRQPLLRAGARIDEDALLRLVRELHEGDQQLSRLQQVMNSVWSAWMQEGTRGPVTLKHLPKSLKAADIQASVRRPAGKDAQPEPPAAEPPAEAPVPAAPPPPPAAETPAPESPADTAEQAFAAHSPAEQQALARALAALAEVHPDASIAPQVRSAEVRTLAEIAGLPAAALARHLQAWADRSLLRAEPAGPVGPASMVHLAQPELLRTWPRLAALAGQERHAVAHYRNLAATAVDGQALTEADLQAALDWWRSSPPSRAWGMLYHPEFDTIQVYAGYFLESAPPAPEPPPVPEAPALEPAAQEPQADAPAPEAESPKPRMGIKIERRK